MEDKLCVGGTMNGLDGKLKTDATIPLQYSEEERIESYTDQKAQELVQAPFSQPLLAQEK